MARSLKRCETRFWFNKRGRAIEGDFRGIGSKRRRTRRGRYQFFSLTDAGIALALLRLLRLSGAARGDEEAEANSAAG